MNSFRDRRDRISEKDRTIQALQEQLRGLRLELSSFNVIDHRLYKAKLEKSISALHAEKV